MKIKPYLTICDPIPIPLGSKGAPPDNTTGNIDDNSRVIYDRKDVQRHLDNGNNWGGVVKKDFIVLDVDAYRNDSARRIAEQMINDYKFPPTLHISARHEESPLSGHYWFKLPKNHDYENMEFRGRLHNYGVEWGEIRHRSLSYLIMPGSRVNERVYEAKVPWETIEGDFNPDLIPEIPKSLYLALIRPAPKPLKTTKGGKYTKSQKESMKQQARWSLWEFRMAQEGSRDNKHYKACLDIGGLLAVGVSKSIVDGLVANLEKYGKENGADKSTMGKTDVHIERGMREPKLLQASGSGEAWWFSRTTLENTYNRALLDMDSPWATLLTELVILSSATDHRVLLNPWTKDKASPIALWAGIIASPGGGKSRTFARSLEAWGEHLPELAKPPKPEPARLGGDTVSFHTAESYSLATDPLARISDPQTGPGLLRSFVSKVDDDEGKKKIEAKTFYRLLAYYDEPDALFRQTAQENNLLSVLRTTYYSRTVDPMIGKTEGQFYLKQGTYSVDLLTAIQPYRMAQFRAMESSGTYQRFIFCDSGVDIETVKKMRQYRNDYPDSHTEVAPWHPQKHKLTKGRKAIVEIESQAREELEAMTYWGLGDSDSNYDTSQVAEWRAMAPRGRPEEVLGHLDVRLQRLAVMLARHDGLDFDDRKLIVPYTYFADAKEIMKHSAFVVASTIAQDANKEVTEEKKRIAKTVAIAKKVKEAEIEVIHISLEGWIYNYLKERDGETTWRGLTKAAIARKLAKDTEEVKTCISKLDDVELHGSPKMVILRG